MPAVSVCSAAGIKATNPLLFGGVLSIAQLKATKILAMAYASKALGGIDYTSVAALQPAVADFFSHGDAYLQEAAATVALSEVQAAAGNVALFKSLPTILAAVNPITTQMSGKELDAAEVLLRCYITAYSAA